jgi:hypothetical protein
MWQKLKAILKDAKSYLGMVVSVFGAANNYLHLFMPLAPDMRLRASVLVILIPAVGVGITIARVHDKAGPGLRTWAPKVSTVWTVLGLLAWAAYAPIVASLERHSSTPFVSSWFDALQIGAYILPFFCWSIALSALSSLFL